MSDAKWTVASASVAGTAHQNSGGFCQDVHRIEIMDGMHGATLLACVADGAGSASHGHVGASLACETWLEQMHINADEGWKVGSEYGHLWAEVVGTKLRDQSSSDGVDIGQYACTFLGACVQPQRALFVQLGDGAVVIGSIGEAGEYEPVFWPAQGEYANTTRFLTDLDAASQIKTWTCASRIDEVAMFTDGLQRLALDYDQKTAFTPFFESMFKHLYDATPGAEDELCEALRRFLESDTVNSRTDDDKSLVLATRRNKNS